MRQYRNTGMPTAIEYKMAHVRAPPSCWYVRSTFTMANTAAMTSVANSSPKIAGRYLPSRNATPRAMASGSCLMAASARRNLALSVAMAPLLTFLCQPQWHERVLVELGPAEWALWRLLGPALPER